MGSYSHILAGFSLGFRHRRELRSLLDNTSPNSCILELDPEALFSSGITVLALDFDGVLANHGAAVPLPEAVEWMKRCEAVFGGDKIFILSNKPTEGRRKWFAEHFPPCVSSPVSVKNRILTAWSKQGNSPESSRRQS